MGVLEVVSESDDAGEFVARHRVEVGVAAAEIDGAVADAEVRQPVRVVVAHRMSPVP
jgi:carbon monoxide dehydrogenase subunit G